MEQERRPLRSCSLFLGCVACRETALDTAQILVPGLLTGDAASQQTMDMARGLDRQGWDVRVRGGGPAGPVPDDISARYQVAEPGNKTALASLTVLKYPGWYPLAETVRTQSGAVLFWYHGVTPPALWQGEDRFDILRNSQIRTELAWHAHLAGADSPFGAQELHDLSGYPLDRIRVVPLGFDLGAWSRPADPAAVAQIRRRWQVADSRLLLYVGRIAAHKRIDLLIHALARLLPDHPDLHLLIVGDVTANPTARILHAELLDLAATLGVGDRITFTGRVPDVAPFYHAAHVALLASQHEGFGAPLVEAMSTGTPVIASASGSMPWVVEGDEGNAAGGLLFEPGDAASLAEQIRTLLDGGDAVRDRFAQQARQRAAYFSLDKFEARIMAVVEETLALAQAGEKVRHPASSHPLYAQADVALRGPRPRSGVPVLGPLIDWVRRNSTTHVKEAYVDRIIEQQVNVNRALVAELHRLQSQVDALKRRLDGDEMDESG